uniref:hypothetical protein n=1 Tax=Bradyrhizobium sp. (strain ORS 278) TaxID=114615 RepID=UPI0015679D93|nr:hypothetical protein [Bradyrhizobium sp. ORS 278]
MSAALSRVLRRKLGTRASPAASRRGGVQIPLEIGLLGLLALALIMSGVVAWLVLSMDDADTADGNLAQLVMSHERPQYAGDEDGTGPLRGFPPVVPAMPESSSVAPASLGAAHSPMDANASLRSVAQPERPAAVNSDVLSGLRISSQSWRRGGLGSKALVTFTLRNTNDFAVKDVEISCAFNRRDGGHVTDRRRIVPGEVRSQSRKTFAAVHVGFVNVNVSTAKCALVAATKI